MWYFVAPHPFWGDKSDYFGHRLTFALRTEFNGTESDFFAPFVVISGTDSAGAQLHLFQSQSAHSLPGENWTQYAIRLDATAGWRVANNASLVLASTATEDDIRQVLSSVTSLRIRGEYGGTQYRGDLDTVSLGQ
jgi:hypothetical protein